MTRSTIIAAAFALLLTFSQAQAADDVVIGAVYPLSGNGSQVGLDAKAALELEAEIINGAHDVPMLLGKGGGLSGLGGAKIRLVFADHQSDPQKARAEAERLITQEHVAAIIGSYQSSTAVTISQICDRYEIPYMSADNSSPSLNQRGLKWFFRTSPHDIMFTDTMFKFFKEIGDKTSHPVKTVSLIYEDDIFGTDSSAIMRKDAAAAGIKVVADIRYRQSSPSLSIETQRLKEAAADVVMPTSFTSDAILMIRGMNDIGYVPPAIMAQSAGFQEQNFISAVGKLADGTLSRSSFAIDATKSRPAIAPVNAMFHAVANKDLNDNTSREIVALQTLADAINRAGSIKAEDIRKALIATDIKGEDTIMPWTGIKFDETGQNTLGTPVIQQLEDGKYHTVWPDAVAATPLIWNVGK